ncbi:Heme oxygenase [Pseudomonas sp. 28 E 9]|uniref:biliverdin-producing heme oxygenase n=1 Tax=Pseudomonas sp. 28 E 9 TaxID=1844098 RepID=UPI0008123974|nr:biliverdin-producing heme oxygenase [Pseudomonas sp. 28 E 9]CRM63828.1 Heme oxygenase [Pseudomonas sp. 28 E 9]
MNSFSGEFDRVEPSRVRRLKAATVTSHAQVDELVMAARPFDSVSRYSGFLGVQHHFHGALHRVYADPTLNAWLPGLSALSRLPEIETDMGDLGVCIPPHPPHAPITSPWQALGWLYCCEGSNLGAAFLLKQAQRLQLGSEYGARHLSAHPLGRGAHWRAFTTLVDGLTLTLEQDLQAEEGAREAFDFYRRLLGHSLKSAVLP